MSEQGDRLESWKLIAAYLDRSERTVRRWESTEGLPVHRHEHEKAGTVVAFSTELDEWRSQRMQPAREEHSGNRKGRRWMLGYGLAAAAAGSGALAVQMADSGGDGKKRGDAEESPEQRYLSEHAAIMRTIDRCIAAWRVGNGDFMRTAFHPKATVSGYMQGVDYSGAAEILYTWVDENGPVPEIEPRIARIDVLDSIAIVHGEILRFSGELVKSETTISSIFTLLKCDSEWKISQKAFHFCET